MSNASCRSVDDLIQESMLLAHDEKQYKNKWSRLHQALGAVLLAVIGVALVALGMRSSFDTANVEQKVYSSSRVNTTSSDELQAGAPYLQNTSSDLKQRQMTRYREGRALMISVHITHHAGTAFCSEMHRWGPVPQFACMGGNNWKERKEIAMWRNDRPWNAAATATRADGIRHYFHMISWEFGKIPNPPLQKTNWEYENVLSVYITRNPMDRLLSGGGGTNRQFGTLEERTIDQWWDYSNSTYTDNFALDRLTGGKCVDGENTSRECLKKGKDLLRRFTIILDQDCLSESVTALARLLDKPEPSRDESLVSRKVPKSAAKSAKQRIHHDDVYEYLLKRNKMDIALYEWSKSISLVKCDTLEGGADEVQG